MSPLRLLLNVLWLLTGGVWMAAAWLFAGIIMAITIIGLPWTKSSPADLVNLHYAYDRASNRTSRTDIMAESFSQPFDELYTYDGLHRLKTMTRGTTSSGFMNPALQQRWELDATEPELVQRALQGGASWSRIRSLVAWS